MNWEYLKKDQYVLYSTMVNIWLSKVVDIDFEEGIIELEDIWNQNMHLVPQTSIATLKEIEGCIILKTYNKIPKEFLI